MENTRCCVCHEYFADDEVRWLGGRAFCAAHHARAIEATSTHWSRAGLVESALVALFVLGVALIFGSHPLPTSLDVGLGLALVPAVIWMVFIYRQDRVEPEPIGLVVGVFVLGGLIATAAQGPLLEVFDVERWHHRDGLSPWIASITIEGTVAMLCAYLAVRYSVFFTSELDEPVDGVIYATAASLGVATASNVDLVLHHQGVLPLAGATAMASTTLVHVAAGVVLGYGIGRRRFDSAHGHRWMALAFLGSVIVQGAFHELVARAGTIGGSFDPVLGFGVALGLGVVVLVGSHVLTMRFAREALEEGRVGFHE
ncbi:MAG: PrsW family intramembrane metalloprotease [Sandaracinus sp.]|nr:PrsW family intramembrane metalloprotease [Sandaracinus sp.]